MKEDKPKFLFYYCGKPVYEGDETHKTLLRAEKDFGGSLIEMAKHDARQINKILKGKNEK